MDLRTDRRLLAIWSTFVHLRFMFVVPLSRGHYLHYTNVDTFTDLVRKFFPYVTDLLTGHSLLVFPAEVGVLAVSKKSKWYLHCQPSVVHRDL